MKQVSHALITAALVLIAFQQAMAGHEVGNGGIVVACRDNQGQIQSVELFDYYEARELRGIHIDLGSPGFNVERKTKIALDRLARFSPLRAQTYAEQIKSFPTEARFLKGAEIPPLSDAGDVFLPRGCQIEQIVIQKEPRFPGDPRYLVNQDLWDKMDSANLAGLLLHEVIYREGIQFGHQTSIASRYFNSIISSQEFDKLTMKSFIELLFLLPFTKTDIAGNQFAIATCGQGPDYVLPCATPSNLKHRQSFKFYPSGNLASFQPQESPYGEGCYPFTGTHVFVNGYLSKGSEDYVHFYACRSDWQFHDKATPQLKSYGGAALKPITGPFGSASDVYFIKFDELGNVSQINGPLQSSQGFSIQLTPGFYQIYLRPDGTVEEIESATRVGPVRYQGNLVDISGQNIKLDRNLNATGDNIKVWAY